MKIADSKVCYALGDGQFFSEADLGGFDIWTEWFVEDEWVRAEDVIYTVGYVPLFKQNYEFIIIKNSLRLDEI